MSDDGSDRDQPARFGLIVPSSNTTAEPELRRFGPDGTTVHAARMALEDVTVDALDEMSHDAIRGGELLGHADVDAVAYACTTGSLLHGPGFDAELESEIGEAAGVPAVATARSVCRALEALGAERIAVATPYTADLDAKEREFLEAADFEVVAIEGRGIEANTDIGALGPADAREQVLTVTANLEGAVDGALDTSVDAVFVSCTNYRSLDAVAELEAELGVPVVTSNGATLWDLCGHLDTTVDAPGALFAEPSRHV